MRKFQKLTEYISLINQDNIGTWVVDQENDGTMEKPIQMPFVNYSTMIHRFVEDVYAFNNENPEFGLNNYYDILKKNDLEWGSGSMSSADVSDKDAQCVLALILAVVRADRFCEGALLSFFNDGSIKKWLKRLIEIDEKEI